MTDLLWVLVRSLAGLVAFVLLLRTAMAWWRVSPFSPMGQLIYRITNPITRPVSRLIPPGRRLDRASLAIVILLAVGLVGLRLLTQDRFGPMGLEVGWVSLLLWPGFAIALATVIEWILQLALLLVIAEALMSFFGAGPAAEALRASIHQLAEPMLKPIRQAMSGGSGSKRAPSRVSGGGRSIDWSPLVALLILQFLMMANGRLMSGLSQQIWG